MGRGTSRVIMTVAGIAILVGYFMPWFDYQGLVDASGFTLLRKAELPSLWLAALLVVPAAGLLLSAAGLSGVRFARYLALLVGALIIGYGSYRFFQIFFSTTGPGIWLVVTGGLIALVLGLLPERAAMPSLTSRAPSSMAQPKPRPPTPPKRAESETKELPPLG